MLNKLTVSELAELSKLSGAYISQVKHGKRPPSKKLLDALVARTKRDEPEKDYFALFIESRNAMGASPKTIRFYKERLSKFANDVNYLKASKASIQRYLTTIPPNRYGLATRHASFRTIKAFNMPVSIFSSKVLTIVPKAVYNKYLGAMQVEPSFNIVGEV